MPNHVTNVITFNNIDQDKAVELIEKYTTEECIDFNKIIPQPDDLYQGALGEKEREIHGTHNWYDWNNKHWGTKWGGYDGDLSYDEDERVLTLTFFTAWSSPSPIIEKLINMDDVPAFSYNCFDEGECFWGCIMVSDDGTISTSMSEHHNKMDIMQICYGDEYVEEYLNYDEGEEE